MQEKKDEVLNIMPGTLLNKYAKSDWTELLLRL